jgi:hypothetical protein
MNASSIVSLVLSSFAVVVAVWAGRTQLRSVRESVRAAAVSNMYTDFRRLTELRLENWEHSHILEPPANYEHIKRIMRLALSDLDAKGQARHVIKERSVALGIFQLFEQTLYQVRDAHGVDHNREAFLNDVLHYMTTRLFLNPRLLYLWSLDGGSLCEDFEPETIAYFDQHVPRDKMYPDTIGLFGGDDE